MVGGAVAGIDLAVLEALGSVPPGWQGRLPHGLGFNLVTGLLAMIASAAVSTWLCGAPFGKLVLRMRVVRADGARAGIRVALVRELAFPIDGFFFGLVAYGAMGGSPLKRRHGDRWGGTAVVRSGALSSEVAATRGRLALGIGLLAHVIIQALSLVLEVR